MLLNSKEKDMAAKLNRRNFMKTAAVSIAAMKTGPAIAKTRSANGKLDIAFIGTGGQGGSNLKDMFTRNINITAVCDVDFERAGPGFRHFEKSRRFTDYREMFDKAHKDFDAVVVSTPDHTHFHPGYTAMDLGKHLYIEKPMAHSVWEIRKLTELAAEKGLATQLGAQRHVKENMHRVVELIQTGAIGDVEEVYSWVSSDRGMRPRAGNPPPVPDHLNYELWLGPAEQQPYDPDITPYGWRFWWDFGTGEPGNWGCHILDIPFWALGLDYPAHVKAAGPEPHPEMTMQAFTSTFDFPAKGDRPAVKLHWDMASGGPDILRELKLPAKGNNNLFIGTKGMLLCGFDQRILLPRDKFEGFEAPEPFIPDSPGFRQEFIDACLGGKTPPTCNFSYSGPLSETVILANVAYRSKSEFDWDHKTMTCKNAPEAQALIKPVFKKGWEMDV
jgi:predicted dehydrogenase